MMKKVVLLIVFNSMLFFQLAAQNVNWNVALGDDRDILLVPASVTINFPTANVYKIGAFSLDGLGSTMICMGSGDYTPGSDLSFSMLADPASEVGYKLNERFVTLVQDQTTMITYAVEFDYQNNDCYYKNTYSYTHTVTGVKCSSWSTVLPGSIFCKNSQPVAIPCIPYGIMAVATYSSGVVFTVDNFIDIAAMSVGTHSVSITPNSPNIKFLFLTQSFQVTSYPYATKDSSIALCPTVSAVLPAANPSLSLTYTPVGSYGYVLSQPGTYVYQATYTVTGCQSYDTIRVVRNLNCQESNLLLNPEAVNPADATIYFDQDETVKIFDKSNKEVIRLEAPVTWDGKDKYGVALPIGIYFILHEDGSKQSITIVH